MNSQLMMSLAVRLCCADIHCGFISVAPVLGNRNELIRQRLIWYREWLNQQGSNELQAVAISPDLFPHLMTQAVELTCADIVSDVIAVAPVLYDRDTRIMESVIAYFSWLRVYEATDTGSNEQTVTETAE